MDVRWLFLDMNSFFASVEQQEHPELRGKPVGVVPVLSDSTCCIAASYEAKKFGIRTGTNVGEAKRLCPQIQLVEAKHGPYRAYHHRIIKTVEKCIPVTKVLSVDEMVCRLWSNERDVSDAVAMAKQVKQAIKQEVGECLHCSVGLGFNPFIAKVATEVMKPDGLVVLRPEDLPGRLKGLRLTDLPGINRRMEARLHMAGVGSIERMYSLSEEEMGRVWGGVVGRRWWHMLRDDTIVDQPTTRASVSHSHVLPPELRTRAGSWAVAMRLLEKAAERMRKLGYGACGLSVYVKSQDRNRWRRDVRLSCSRDTWTLIAALKNIWEHPFTEPMQVAISLHNLVPQPSVTLSLFDETALRMQATEAVDAMNLRYGRGTVFMGGVFPARDTAEDKIAFAKVD